ncbi:hypothetical protein MLD38_004799 [Melastoma candidum]|uniref:Uncharacterized protein n=2 Tax=Melastoma candidum TaxID=119954 RepID=A0ACB9S6K7_9MYRT|nr:hypothetical protein MLD38_004799 [Melastoma candidum]
MYYFVRNSFMATATMATAAGAAALLYYTLSRKIQNDLPREDEDNVDAGAGALDHVGMERVSGRLIQAPVTWLETISTLSETLKFTYSETLGKWPIADLAFGINFLLKRQGILQVCNVFGGEDCEQVTDRGMIPELRYLMKLLTLCWYFSKKSFPVFLKENGFLEENVLLHQPKPGILKPAFTIVVDHNDKRIILLIRGTHSIKDTLTAVTGGVVPFHHSVVGEGGVTNVVLGYAHCGMVAAARWIAKLSKPCLLGALEKHPDYKIHIMGHSLGGGTAALVTFILREQKELSKATCYTFASAACMTWELAESGNDFITSIINGADIVPTFSTASLDDLRAEVTASAWINDLRNQIERTRILSTVYRSASALGSRLPSIATTKAKVAGAGAILRPVSSGTQVVMRQAQSMAQAAWTRPAISLSSWSCIGPRHRKTASHSRPKDGSETECCISDEANGGPLLTVEQDATGGMTTETATLPVSSCEQIEWTSEIESPYTEGIYVESENYGDEDGEDLIDPERSEARMSEVELWQRLEDELCSRARGEAVDVAKEMREEEHKQEQEEAAALAEVGVVRADCGSPSAEKKEVGRFFPPGRTLHLVTLPRGSQSNSPSAPDDGIDPRVGMLRPPGLDSPTLGDSEKGPRVGLFYTPRSLYSKIRLSQTMIRDHFMPIYRRQIERVIKALEEVDDDDDREVVL